MANIATDALPSAAFTGSDEVVGNQGGVTKRMTLDFDSMSDNDDGEWVPVLQGETSTGSNTYTTQTGYYTAIGDLVLADFFVTISALSSTGNLTLSGLPFAPQGTSRFTSTVLSASGLSLTDESVIYGVNSSSNTYIRLFHMLATGGSPLTDTEITSSFNVRGTFIYRK